MQCLNQSRGQSRKGRSLSRHRRPFFVRGLLYVAVEQSINARLLFFGESSGEENDSTKCAGLGRNRDLCFIESTPDLDGDKTNQQREKDAQWGSIPGEIALNARARSFTASMVTTQ